MNHTAWIINAADDAGARLVAPFLLPAIRFVASKCCQTVEEVDAYPGDQQGASLLLDASMPFIEECHVRALMEAAIACGGTAVPRGGHAYPRCVAGASGEVREVNIEGAALARVLTPKALAAALHTLAARKCDQLMEAGVLILDPTRTTIASDVRIGRGTVVHPGVTISGGSVIGRDTILLPGSRIDASHIGDGTTVESSVLLSCEIGNKTTVGPFAYIRPGTKIGNGCRVGDFVEIKNSVIGDGTKVSHLTYVGDSDLGERINLGCGVVFVNYDGKKKHRTVVEDDAFIGCNVNLVSPVKVGQDAYVAAGSTITEDVPGGALAVARQRQTVKEGWVAERRTKGNL